MHKHELAVNSADQIQCVFTYVHDTRLIMLHSPDISAQWPVDSIGVILQKSSNVCQIGFSLIECPLSYQSFFIDGQNYADVYRFFKALRFPLHGAPEPES